jgi:hypothetical protein
MSQRARIATSLLSAAAIAAIVALLAIGATGSSSATACGAATDRTYLAARFGVVHWINVGELSGHGVKRAVQTIESDPVLADAVASSDLATVRSEVRLLVYNHEHIVRLRVLRAGRVLDDLGGPLVLAPVSGTLRVGPKVVGTFVMSVQDDAGYSKLAQRLAGADSVIRYRGATIMSDIAVGERPLPSRGAVTVHGARYLVESFSAGRFPVGTLRISLLVRQPPAALARLGCAQVGADVLADVARRAYDESKSGPPVVPALATIALDQALPEALAAGDWTGAAKIVRGMVSGGGFARLRVLVGGRVIADAGSSIPLLAPLRRPIVDGAGSVIGTALFAVQNAHGYIVLAQSLTRVPVLVRAGSRQLAGTFPGPARLPTQGTIRYRGVRYAVASFTGVAFPSGSVRIYVLAPA